MIVIILLSEEDWRFERHHFSFTRNAEQLIIVLGTIFWS